MRDGDWLIGWGCASAVYPTHVGAATARVRLLANGKAHVQIAAHEIGTGVRTVIAQMAAERLGMPVSAVTRRDRRQRRCRPRRSPAAPTRPQAAARW